MGTGSMGRAFAELGWEVTSLDVDPKADPTICADICSWEPLPKLAPGYFDMIWASPVCTEYSRVLTRRPRRLEEGDRLVLRTLQIIQELQPRFWAMENPATGLLKLRPFMAEDLGQPGLGAGTPSLRASRLPLRAVQRTGSPPRGGAEGHLPPQWQDSAELPQPSAAVQHPASLVSGDRRRGQRKDRDFALGFFSSASILLWRLLQTPHSTAVSLL